MMLDQINNSLNMIFSIIVEDAHIQDFLSVIGKYKLVQFEETTPTLESYFMHFYKSDKKFGGIK